MFIFRGPLNIRRAESGEKIFRQSKQKSARVVPPTRRNFVTNDGKDSTDSQCDDFLEVPFKGCFVKGKRTLYRVYPRES